MGKKTQNPFFIIQGSFSLPPPHLEAIFFTILTVTCLNQPLVPSGVMQYSGQPFFTSDKVGEGRESRAKLSLIFPAGNQICHRSGSVWLWWTSEAEGDPLCWLTKDWAGDAQFNAHFVLCSCQAYRDSCLLQTKLPPWGSYSKEGEHRL